MISNCDIVGAPLEDIAEEEEPVEEEEEDGDIGEEDEMADFIVDEEEVDEHGAPVRYIPCYECVCCLLCVGIPTHK